MIIMPIWILYLRQYVGGGTAMLTVVGDFPSIPKYSSLSLKWVGKNRVNLHFHFLPILSR